MGTALLTAVAGCAAGGGERGRSGPDEQRDGAVTAAADSRNLMAPPSEETNITIAEITGGRNNHEGKKVYVEGWAEQRYGAHSFRLDEDSVFTGGIDNDLLVIGPADVIPAGLKFGDADSKVRVWGIVRRMINEIERDNGIDLSPEVEAEFREKPVLVAQHVQVILGDD